MGVFCWESGGLFRCRLGGGMSAVKQQKQKNAEENRHIGQVEDASFEEAEIQVNEIHHFPRMNQTIYQITDPATDDKS